MIKRRRRFKQFSNLEDRLIEHSKALREEAKQLPPGAKRESLLRRARQNDAAAGISEFLRSPGARMSS